MFFDSVTPDTSAYMVAGYTVFFVVSLIYLVSLYVRNRNLHQDLDTLEGLEKEKAAPAPAPALSAAPSQAGKPKPVRAKAARPAAKKAPSRKKTAAKSAKKR